MQQLEVRFAGPVSEEGDTRWVHYRVLLFVAFSPPGRFKIIA